MNGAKTPNLAKTLALMLLHLLMFPPVCLVCVRGSFFHLQTPNGAPSIEGSGTVFVFF